MLKQLFDRYPLYLFAAALLFCACFAHAQSVSPFLALGNAQFFDNNGQILTSGVLYSYQAGTTSQQATYTDSTGLTSNPNPLPFGSGARVAIWLTSTAKYKFVLCIQNDGASCAPSDILFSVDQVPGCMGCAAASNIFTGTFISGTPNPASTGILELASIDSICWRNAANNANLCISKDPSDVLTWTGGTTKFLEGSCTVGAANYDYLCPNSATHHMSGNFNNGGYGSVPVVPNAGVSAHLPSFLANGIDLQDSGATAPVSTAVTFSATPTFTATSQDQLFTMTLSGNVTSSTLVMTGLPSPTLLSFELTQGGSGGYTFVYPANVIGGITPTGTLGSVTMQHFIWDGTNARAVTLVPVNPAVQASSITTLGGSVNISGNTNVSVMTKSVTMPASGCPCRALVSYGAYVSFSNAGQVAMYVSDGTNSFATAEQLTTGAASNFGVNGTSFSTGTYANNANVTFTLFGNSNAAGTSTVLTANGPGTSQSTWLNVAILGSN